MSQEIIAGSAAAIAAVKVAQSDVVRDTANRAMTFLGRICNPAATELGLLLGEHVAAMRSKNAALLLSEAESRLRANGDDQTASAPPRLVHRILDSGSWVDEGHLRDLWAGLLASSCTPSGDDDSNLLFTNLLENLSGLQSRLLEFACTNAIKRVTPHYLITAQALAISFEKICVISCCDDIQRLDREMDHLRETGLLQEEGGFTVFGGIDSIYLTPSALALQLWCRCQGSRKSAPEYFGLCPETAPVIE